MIHIVNGDCVGSKIQHLEGDVIVWREMYDFGPLNKNWNEQQEINNRACYFEQKLKIPAELFISSCEKQLALLQSITQEEEIVLWFEHDRYDQAMLMSVLTKLLTRGMKNISIVSINKYPGIKLFFGLGQLSSQQLEGLLSKRKEVTNYQVEEAISGWKAYTSEQISDVDEWIRTQNHTLPFLVDALNTHKDYFPAPDTGLNKVETLALSFIQEGTSSFANLFRNVSEKRINDGLSDLHFSAILKEISFGESPLVRVDSSLPNFETPDSNPNLELTTDGLAVLNGEKNRFDLMGIDWWVGGIHLCVNC